MSSENLQPFCPGLNVIKATISYVFQRAKIQSNIMHNGAWRQRKNSRPFSVWLDIDLLWDYGLGSSFSQREIYTCGCWKFNFIFAFCYQLLEKNINENFLLTLSSFSEFASVASEPSLVARRLHSLSLVATGLSVGYKTSQSYLCITRSCISMTILLTDNFNSIFCIENMKFDRNSIDYSTTYPTPSYYLNLWWSKFMTHICVTKS